MSISINKYIIDFFYKDKENNEKIKNLFNEDIIKNIFSSIIEELKIDYFVELSVEWVDDSEAHELNKTYRKKDYIPDVLSFPLDDDFYLQTKHRVLGDLILNFNEMIRKTKDNKNSLEAEGFWCFIHGVLHLFGFDHEINKEQEKIMFDLTDKILKKYNNNYNL